jgi:ketosteroid isomerase-like protein
MSAAANKQLVQKVFAGLAQGDPKLFVDSMDEKFRWRISGDSPWSKTFEGKQAVLGGLFVLLRDRIADRPRTIAHRFIAEDDLVVVEASGNNVSKTGAVYDNSYCFVIRVSEGKLQEITEYCDTDLAMNALGAPPES